MDKNIEQRICLKFCIANGISCSESLKMLQKIYGKATLSKTRAYEWYNAFKSGRDEVNDLPRSGRPSTSLTENNIAKVKELVTGNSNLSLREIAAELSVSHESIRTILNKKMIPMVASGSAVPTKRKRALESLDLAEAPPAKNSTTKVTKTKQSRTKSSGKTKKTKSVVKKTVSPKKVTEKKVPTSSKKSSKPKPTAVKVKKLAESPSKKRKTKQREVTSKAKSLKKATSSKKK